MAVAPPAAVEEQPLLEQVVSDAFAADITNTEGEYATQGYEYAQEGFEGYAGSSGCA